MIRSLYTSITNLEQKSESVGTKVPMGSVLKSILGFALQVFYPMVGFGIFLVLWKALSLGLEGSLPSPEATLVVFYDLVSNPFYINGSNDIGIGYQLGYSMWRVAKGFFFASVVAIPLGMLIGSSKLFYKMFDPIVQILKPVSPLAWFPIGLVVFKDSTLATIFIIFITSLWPTLINTAVGVASIPDDFKNVGKAFGFSLTRYVFKIMIPYSLPHIITGLRLSIGVAWLVIVAGEMLSGGTGIGFFVWDCWNALSLEKVISAIMIIGIVGLLLDRTFLLLAKKFTYK
jgi:nitrate/nitrite transport system permease protein